MHPGPSHLPPRQPGGCIIKSSSAIVTVIQKDSEKTFPLRTLSANEEAGKMGSFEGDWALSAEGVREVRHG